MGLPGFGALRSAAGALSKGAAKRLIKGAVDSTIIGQVLKVNSDRALEDRGCLS